LAARIELVERAVTSRSDELVRTVEWSPGSRVSTQGTIETTTVSIDDFNLRGQTGRAETTLQIQ
jgi:hypothetical protein